MDEGKVDEGKVDESKVDEEKVREANDSGDVDEVQTTIFSILSEPDGIFNRLFTSDNAIWKNNISSIRWQY